MTYDELVEGHRNLYARLLADDASFKRLANKLRFMKNPLTSPHLSLGKKINYVFRLFWRGVTPGGLKRIYYFSRSVMKAFRRPNLLAAVVTDWIIVLSLKAFLDRSLAVTTSRTTTVLEMLQKKMIRKLQEAKGIISLRLSPFRDRPHIWIDLKRTLNVNMSKKLAIILRKTLKCHCETLVINCQELADSSGDSIKIIFQKLESFGDHVHVYLTDSLHQRLHHHFPHFHYMVVGANI